MAVVYVAQNDDASERDWDNCRRQLSGWQSRTAVLVVIIDVVEIGAESGVQGGDVGGGIIQEQAEDTRDTTLEHCDTKGGNPVVAVSAAVVYVAQKVEISARD
jgi:hypothetical protein